MSSADCSMTLFVVSFDLFLIRCPRRRRRRRRLQSGWKCEWERGGDGIQLTGRSKESEFKQTNLSDESSYLHMIFSTYHSHVWLVLIGRRHRCRSENLKLFLSPSHEVKINKSESPHCWFHVCFCWCQLLCFDLMSYPLVIELLIFSSQPKKNKAKKPQSTSESFWGEVGEHVSMWHFCVSADLVSLPLASSHRHCCATSIECILCALLIVHPFIATVFHHYHQCCCCFHSILISAVFFVHFRAVLNRHQIKLCAHFFNCHS